MGFWDKVRDFFGIRKKDEPVSTTQEEPIRQEALKQAPISPDSFSAERERKPTDVPDGRLASDEADQVVGAEDEVEEETDELPLLEVPTFEVPSSTYQSSLTSYYLPTTLSELVEQARLVDQSRSINPKLLALALEDGLLLPTRALQLARHQPTPTLRADALLALLAWQPANPLPPEWAELPAETWQAVQAIPVAAERATRLIALELPEAHATALDAAQTIRDPAARVKILAQIGAWVEALKALSEVGSQLERAEALIRLAPELPQAQLSDALQIAQGLDDYSRYTVDALCALIPRLSPALMNDVRNWVWHVKDELAQVAIGSCLAAYLLADELPTWIERLRAVAEKEEYASKRIQLWLKLMPYLPAQERETILNELVPLARRQKDPGFRAEALGWLAFHLPPVERERLLAEAGQSVKTISEPLTRNRLWGEYAKGLCQQSDDASIKAGLRMMANVQEIYLRTAYLKEIAPQLARLTPSELVTQMRHLLPQPLTQVIFWQEALPHLTPAHLAAIWHEIAQMEDATARSTGLIALAPHLPDKRGDMVRDALAAAQTPPRNSSLPVLLAALANRLPFERSALLQKANRVLAEWDDPNQVYILANMIGQLGSSAPPTLLAQAISHIERISDISRQSLAWHILLTQAPPEKQTELAQQALPVVLKADHPFMSQRLKELVPYLPDNQLPFIWQQINTRVDPMQLPAFLAQIAPRMSPALREDALQELLKLPAHRMRELAEGLSSLIPHLPGEQIEQARNAAQKIRFPAPRILVQAALAAEQEPSTRSELLAHLLTQADEIRLPASRIEALAHLAISLSGPQRSTVLHNALRLLLTIEDEASRAHQLRRLLPLTTPQLANEMLYFVTQVGEDRQRAQLLTQLLPHLPSEKVGALLPFISAFSSIYDYDALLTALIPHLPPELLIDALLLIRERAQEPALQASLNTFAQRWRDMSRIPTIHARTELVLTLDAFAKGGSIQLIPALTALLPALETEGGASLLRELDRLLE